MKISAIIPAYNSASFITDAIASIRAQTAPVDEIIIIDDGSTDNTEQIVANLTNSIVYYKQTNQGPSAARNKGIEIAKGDWIAFLDADDQWTIEKIRRQQQILATYPSLHLIAGDMAEIAVDDTILVDSVLAKHHLLDSFNALGGKPIPNALSRLIEKNFIPTGTVLAKRSTLLEAGLFNTEIRFGEDLELWAKIAAKYPIACLPEVLMLRRQHGNNATQASEKMLQDLTKVMESIRKNTRTQLLNQDVDPVQMVAGSYWTLGYWYFSVGEYTKARTAFLKSLHEQWKLSSAIYFMASLLPHSAISALRRYKQKFT
ncbi:MAG: glycosyltransferase family 2 protein [Gammaproteobacteria bacterium]